jgi:hypothetical protein
MFQHLKIEPHKALKEAHLLNLGRAQQMSLDDIPGTDLFDFFAEVRRLCESG